MSTGMSVAKRTAVLVCVLCFVESLAVIVQPLSSVFGASCQGSGSAGHDVLHVGMTCEDPGSNVPVAPVGDEDPAIVEYRWVSVCESIGQQASGDISYDCGAARTCPDPADRLWRLWGGLDTGEWIPVSSQCLGAPPTAAQTPKPQVTPGLVLNAIRRIGLPQLSVHIQPQGKTLVNFDTNFYVDPQQFNRTLTLLGQSVDVEATPTGYTWRHGDGTSATTTDPGAPYPELAVTYAYPTAATVAPSVQVTYTARFRVGGGAWQQIPGTVTVDGPPTNLLVVEGTGVLSGDH